MTTETIVLILLAMDTFDFNNRDKVLSVPKFIIGHCQLKLLLLPFDSLRSGSKCYSKDNSRSRGPKTAVVRRIGQFGRPTMHVNLVVDYTMLVFIMSLESSRERSVVVNMRTVRAIRETHDQSCSIV